MITTRFVQPLPPFELTQVKYGDLLFFQSADGREYFLEGIWIYDVSRTPQFHILQSDFSTKAGPDTLFQPRVIASILKQAAELKLFVRPGTPY